MPRKTTRRDFIKTSTAIGAALYVGGPKLWSQERSPNERVRYACIGIGGKGDSDSSDAANHGDVVAICDVDELRRRRRKQDDRFANAEEFADYREMFDSFADNFDAVTVSTPDHHHYLASALALTSGKACFTQKPMAHSVWEARELARLAGEHNAATQMGNQGTANSTLRRSAAILKSGFLGPIQEVHVVTNRPVWPQGIDRPEPADPPPFLDWEVWLGPAPYRDYAPDSYHDFRWRGWWDFGTGALGDMGCHIFDAPFWALKLGHPTSVEASCTPVNSETAPLAAMVSYVFPERDERPEVKLTWYDGGLRPRRPPELEDGRPMGNKNGGILFVGDKGTIMASDENAQDPRLIPETRMKEYKRPPRSIPRVRGSHEQNWIEAAKGGPPAGSNFDYAGPLTEIVLLGNVAIRSGAKLRWDGPGMKVTNVPEANRFLRDEYREGWSLQL